jgi:hypothetical protein
VVFLKKDINLDDLGLEAKAPDYKSKDKDVEEIFKNREDERVKLLEESTLDIKEMIVGREELHKEMMISFTKIEAFINNTMPDPGAASSEAIKIRQDLIKELLKKRIELDQLRIDETLNFWRDTALLKKELREHMKEFRDMESKTSMIDTILGD